MATTGSGRTQERIDVGKEQAAEAANAGTPASENTFEVIKADETTGGSKPILMAGETTGGTQDVAPVEQQHRVAEVTYPTKTVNDSYDSQAKAVSRLVRGLPLETVRVDQHPGSGIGMAPRRESAAAPSGASGYEESSPSAVISDNQLAGLVPAQQAPTPVAQEQRAVEAPDRITEDESIAHQYDVDISKRQRYAYDDATGRDEIFRHGAIRGATPMSKPYKNNSKSNRRFAESFKRYREKIADKISAKTYRGDSFYDKIHANASVLPNEIALGTENIREALREPNSPFLELLNQKLVETYGPDAPQITREVALRDISIIYNLLNGVPSQDGSGKWTVPPLDIEVVFDKSPVNWGPSIQVRTLRVRYGNGIFVHPTQCKGFNLDFDGDPGSLNTDPEVVKRYNRAMSYLVDTDGRPMVDMKFFPLDEARSGGLATEEMARCMIEGPFSWLASEYGLKQNDLILLARKYIAVCNSPSDANWKEFLDELDSFANRLDARGGFTNAVNDSIAGAGASSYSAASREHASSGFRHLNPGDMARKAHSDNVARLFGSIYEFGVIRRRLSLQTQYPQLFIDSTEGARPSRPDTDPVIWHLVMYHDDIAEGRTAPNFQSFAKSFNKVYGDVDNANVPFRLVADFAKAINRSDAIRIGEDIYGIYQITDEDGNVKDTVTLEDLWRFTCSCAVTTAISGELRYGSRNGAISTVVKTMVIREIGPIPNWSDYETLGFANQDEMFQDWIDRFVDCYNKHARLINASQVSWRHGGLPSRDGATRFDGIPGINGERRGEKLADALVRVYGDMTVGTVFPIPFNDSDHENIPSMGSIHRKYENMRLEEFVYKNRLPWASEVEGVGKMESIRNRLSKGTTTPADVLWLVADRRTTQTGEYMEAWLKATEDHFKRIDIYRIRKKAKAGKIDEVMSDIMECIHMMSPDMFDFFEMSSPESFLNSEYGRRFFASKDLTEFRSNLLSMLVEYRLSRSAEILNDIYYEQENADPASPERSQARLDELEAVFEFELDSLGSSSYAWDTLCKEMTGMNRPLKIVRNQVVGEYGSWFEYMVTRRGNTGKSKWKVYAADTWRKLSEDPSSPRSLIEYLKSDASFEDKINVLTDIVRLSQNYSGIEPNEILGQLAHHPDRLHSGNRFDMDKGLRHDIDSVKESSDRVTSFTKSRKNIKKESRSILKLARSNPDLFEAHLRRMASDPGYHVVIDPILAADAIASVFDPAYSDSEKIRQQAAVNAYFECVSYQRSGGFFTHLNQTDNAVVNMVGANQISEFDIIRVLGDPSVEITVYDEFGCATREPLSRRTLCGGDSIHDVIRFLSEHPKLALATRQLTCGVRTTGEKKFDGQATLNAITLSLDEDEYFGDHVEQRVFSLLCDRPKFLSLAALITPADSNVGRNLSERINENIGDLCRTIAQLANRPNSLISREMVLEALAPLGITEEALAEIRVSSFDEYTGQDGSSDQDDFTANLLDEIICEICDCVSIVENVGDIHVNDQIVKNQHGIDESSVRAYYAAKQQLGGARTQKMIQVEGAETKRNLVLKEFLRNESPIWRSTEHGPERVPMSDAEVKMSGDGAYTVGPETVPYQDATFERAPGKQIHPIAKWLEIKREKGAEDFNAKTKKYGDDGTNSIIKFTRMATRSVFKRYGKNVDITDSKNGIWAIEDGAALRASVSAAATVGPEASEEERRAAKDKAVAILANALVAADARLGYIDFNDDGTMDESSFELADYYERAEMMIAYNSDGTIVIRTLEQIALACEMRLSDAAIESQDADTIRAEIAEIIDVLGTDRDPMLRDRTDSSIALDCMLGAKTRNGIGARFQASRALSRRMSSADRSYEHMLRYRAVYEQMYEREWQRRMSAAEAAGDTALASKLSKKRAAPPPKSRQQINQMSQRAFASLYKKYGRSKSSKSIIEQVKNLVTVDGDDQYSFDFIGMSSDLETYNDINPGPLSLVFFSRDWEQDDTSRKAKDACRIFGMTAAFEGLSCVPDEYVKDAIRVSPNIWIVPFFDMKLNGSMSSPSSFAPGEFVCNPSNWVVNVESTLFDARFGDSTYHMTRELFDRIRVFKTFTETFTWENLFPNVLSAYPDNVKTMDYCTVDELQDYIFDGTFNPETCTIDGPMGSVTIDLGVDRADTKRYEREAERFAIRFQEYKDSFNDVDPNGILTGECRYDSVIGFVKIIIDGNKVVFAPVTAFHLERSGKSPHRFEIDAFEFDPDSHQFDLKCHYTGGLKGQIIKFFEGIGASNKMTASDELIESRELDNGLAVDGMYGTGTVSSRLFASNKRVHTMISLMCVTRMDPKYAYNFAEHRGSFPGDPTVIIGGEEITVREALLDCRLDKEQWRIATGWTSETGCKKGFFHEDPEIDAFVRYWVDLCLEYGTVNPTTLLATKSRSGMLVPRVTEFEAFMDTSTNFQNAFMKFMYTMTVDDNGDGGICPPSIDDPGNISARTLFKPVNERAFAVDSQRKVYPRYKPQDRGVLQMLVPYRDEDSGKWFKVPENVYISMGSFGEEFTGFSKKNFNTYQHSIDTMNVIPGNISGFDLSQMMSFARAGMSHREHMGSMTVLPDLSKDGYGSWNQEDYYEDNRVLDPEEWGRILAVTGHRPQHMPKGWEPNKYDWDPKSPSWVAAGQRVVEYCHAHGINTVISGMAQGFDIAVASAVIQDPTLKLVAAVPFKGSDSTFTKRGMAWYRRILKVADKVVYVSDEPIKSKDADRQHKEASGKLMERNEWMIDNADEVFALFDEESRPGGGTAAAVSYTRDAGKPIEILKPDDILVENEGLPDQDAINPDNDGVDHVNIYSRGKTKLGKFLSNFANTPISLPEGDFQSIEGYWHYLGVPDGIPGKETLKHLSGYKAKELGNRLRGTYGTVRRPDFKDKIRYAIRTKLVAYKDKWIDSQYRDFPLEHYYVGKDGHVNDQSEQFGWLTDMIREEMDREIGYESR